MKFASFIEKFKPVRDRIRSARISRRFHDCVTASITSVNFYMEGLDMLPDEQLGYGRSGQILITIDDLMSTIRLLDYFIHDCCETYRIAAS